MPSKTKILLVKVKAARSFLKLTKLKVVAKLKSVDQNNDTCAPALSCGNVRHYLIHERKRNQYYDATTNRDKRRL